jgi:hypothetical protein
MGRRSSHEHYKDHIFALLKQGRTPLEVLAVYPDLPSSTIYRWFNDYKKEFKNQSHIDSNKSIESPKFTLLDGYAEQSDISLARATLRGLLKQRDCPQSVKVQAALGLMKLAYLRSELPKHIIDEDEKRDISEAREAIGTLTDEELMMRIREKLQAPG